MISLTSQTHFRKEVMIKQKPLWERLYFDAAYIEIARLIGYGGSTYREMMRLLETPRGKARK